MNRYNHPSDFGRFYELMREKSTDELKAKLEHIEKSACAIRYREFNGFKLNPKISRKLDLYAQERMAIETIISERE